jgi:glycosyltransferase involved in cell wall biosynthesis
MQISIIIPVFNEKNTVLEALKRVEAVDLGNIDKEIIIIDDGSTDGTREILKSLENKKYKVIFYERNRGKGVAVRNGFAQAKGDIILIQDADLECDPQNYPALIKPIFSGQADVVYGSRFLGKKFRHFSFWFYLGNKILTSFSNLMTGLKLTDMWTGYKVFQKKVVKEILPTLEAKRFEIDPELTVKVAKKKYRVLEVPLSFFGKSRTKKEGKKITVKDGVAALWYILKFSLK